MTTALPLMNSRLTPLAKIILIPLGLSAGMSTADAATQKKIYGSSTETIIKNKEIEDITKMVK